MFNFKVGDWVRHNEGTCQIKGFISKSSVNRGGIWLTSDYQDGRAIPITDCILWQPKEGEWCWSKTRNSLTSNVCELIRFYEDVERVGACEPFIGTLPTFLKDN